MRTCGAETAGARGGPAPVGEEAFLRLLRTVEGSGFPFKVHSHPPTRTVDDVADNLSLEVARIVKTVAFRTREGEVVLAALKGVQRVNYPRLAALMGMNRRDLAPLSPEEVRGLLGVEPGSVSPLLTGDRRVIFIDHEVLAILPTIYCGMGRPDRTLEIAAADLVTLTGARVGAFSR